MEGMVTLFRNDERNQFFFFSEWGCCSVLVKGLAEFSGMETAESYIAY